MNEISRQVSRARRRIVAGQFFRILNWALFTGLFLAAIGMLIPKIWHLEFLQTADQVDGWNYAWMLGGILLAFLVAAGLTVRQLQSRLTVASEVDKRFNLKERLSSALSLSTQDLETPAGQALLADATRRAETIDVRDQFQFRPSAKALLPVLPLLAMIILLFVPNAIETELTAKEPEPINRRQIEVAIQELKKKQEEKRQELTAKGLADANQHLKSLEKKFDELLEDKNADKKSSLVKLNDIKKQIDERRQEIGDGSELKENLNKLKDIGTGPAKKLTDALSQGDIPEAQKAIKELADKLKEGKLSEIEKKKLVADLTAMADELKKIAEKHQQEKKELEDQIKKALDEGDLDKAAELQQKLEQKQQQEKQMEKMKQLAENLQKCANCMKPGGNGDPKKGQGGDPNAAKSGEQQAQAQQEAAQSLEDLAEQLEQMQQEMQEMDALEDLEKLAGECKGCMNGENPGDEPKWQDWAKGSGAGHGKRDLEKEDTGGFKARVKGQLRQGETVVTGNADGDNITGRSASEARELVQASMSKDSDPLENQKLPKAQREHAQQYFEALRKND